MELEMLGAGLRSESCESVFLNNIVLFFLDFGCREGWKIEEKLKKHERTFCTDFKMVLESIFNDFWSDFGTKLETKLV